MAVGLAARALGACGGSDGQGTAAATPTQLSAKGQAGHNDLPVLWDGNVNIGETPYTLAAFAGGTAPTLSTAEIDDRVAFLCTLTDGFDPKNPAAYNLPAQCAPGAE